MEISSFNKWSGYGSYVDQIPGDLIKWLLLPRERDHAFLPKYYPLRFFWNRYANCLKKLWILFIEVFLYVNDRAMTIRSVVLGWTFHFVDDILPFRYFFDIIMMFWMSEAWRQQRLQWDNGFIGLVRLCTILLVLVRLCTICYMVFEHFKKFIGHAAEVFKLVIPCPSLTIWKISFSSHNLFSVG